MSRGKTAKFTHAAPDARDVLRLLHGAGVHAGEKQSQDLAVYIGLLQTWRKRINLVGPSSWQSILTDLIADSLHLALFLERDLGMDSPRCVDIGAGAGLPGIPLRLVWQRGEYLMVEARRNRAIFLHHAVSVLKPPRTAVREGRVEEQQDLPAGADLVLGRAFRAWPEYLRIARPLLSPTGLAVVFSLAPPPPELGPEWLLRQTYAYPAGESFRYFWLVGPEGGVN